jgi:2-desacetyl-2-hydroxyethyl bacteriochlorophyllide A dehydrogenase
MRALVKTEFGPGHLELRDIPVPQIGPDDVLVEITYCGVCGSDLHIETGAHPCAPPVVLGHEWTGVVARRGDNVTRFSVGDPVSFWQGTDPYPGVSADGGFEEYMCVPAEALWKTPPGITAEEATQFETVITPMALVRDVARLQPGERVVVSGPGPIGLLVANLAKTEGAAHVTVLGAPGDEVIRLPTALEIGADEVALFGPASLAVLEGERAPSVWFEASGAAPAIEAAVAHVARRGRVVVSGLGEGPWNVDMRRVAYESLQILGRWGGAQGYLEDAVELMQSGQLKMSALISEVMPLSEWEAAFVKVRRKEGIKILLDPHR